MKKEGLELSKLATRQISKTFTEPEFNDCEWNVNYGVILLLPVLFTTELDPSNDYIKLKPTFDFIKFTDICSNNYMCFISSATSYKLETGQSETGIIFLIIQLNVSLGWNQLGEEGVW